jgi:hypothetical protein
MNNPLKIGTIAYAAHTGLGILAKQFYDNNVITDVVIVSHTSQGVKPGFYPENTYIIDCRFNQPTQVKINPDHDPFIQNHGKYILNYLENLDILFLFETSFFSNIWYILKHMKNRPKIVMMPMYESTCYQWNDTLQIYPDLLICPSALDYNFYKHLGWFNKDGRDIKSCQINVPVSVDWKERSVAKTFVHNAGNGSYADRNGTISLIKAIPLIKSPIKMRINSQINTLPEIKDSRVEVNTGTIDYSKLWSEGDVFVYPERFNALSLPLNEARAAGMYIIAGDRFPINKWIPKEGLIPVRDYNNINAGIHNIASANYNISCIAKKIDETYNKDISNYSRDGYKWSIGNSWNTLKPQYTGVLEGLLNE